MDSSRRKRGTDDSFAMAFEKRNRQKNFENENFVVATITDMETYFKLLAEDQVIVEFLQRDCCCKVIDKYLLAMVFVYFQRLKFLERNFTRLNFFVALFLAHDMEEDDEEIKHEIFPWALGQNWRRQYPNFMILRDKLWAGLNHRAVVSRTCCDEVFSIIPSHHAWKRERLSHHAGCYRNYLNPYELCTIPRGPHATPTVCKECLMKHFSRMPQDSKICTVRNLLNKRLSGSGCDLSCKQHGIARFDRETPHYLSPFPWSCED